MLFNRLVAQAGGTRKNPRDVEATRGFRGPDRRRSGDLSIFSRTLYQLSYRTKGIQLFWEKEPVLWTGSRFRDPDGT